MRAFNPNRLVFLANTLVHDDLLPADSFPRLPVKFSDPDGPVSVILSRICGRIIVDNIGLTIVIKKQGGINAPNIIQSDGITPVLFFGVIGGDDGGASVPRPGGDHVEQIVVRIVLDGRCVHPARHPGTAQPELRLPVQHMAYLHPVHQVGAVPDGNPGKISKGGIHQVIVIPFAADGRVGHKTGQNGILIPGFAGLSSKPVYPLILEEIKYSSILGTQRPEPESTSTQHP